jgi:glycosyltransferase involved in cell wall biosynthesis
MDKISAYIIAYNEAEKIAAAVNSVLWADEVVVIDSHSQDDTARIAEALGARVVQVEFKGFGELRNQALQACRYEWVFSLDADERCTPEARDEILRVVATPDAADVYYVPRRNYFMGRWIKYSGWYPNYRQPQLFRRDCLEYTQQTVHEGFISHSHKPLGYLHAPIWQFPFKNLEEVIHKANRYSSLGVTQLEAKNRRGSMGRALSHGLWAFVKHYVFKRGFLDGWPGFVIALGNFEGTFYRYAKLYEHQQDWIPPDSPPLRRES